MASAPSGSGSSRNSRSKRTRRSDFAAVLTEPASVVAKAWEHVFRIGRRSPSWAPGKILVTGAGPIGLLAALIGAQHGLSVHVLDRHKTGPKPKLVRDLGGIHHDSTASLGDMQFDVVMECTAASPVIVDAIARCAPSGIVCLVGVSSAGHMDEFDIGGFNRKLVLDNGVVFGTVNANRRHYENAARALAKANRAWLGRADFTAGAAVALAGRVRARSRTTSRSCIDFSA